MRFGCLHDYNPIDDVGNDQSRAHATSSIGCQSHSRMGTILSRKEKSFVKSKQDRVITWHKYTEMLSTVPDGAAICNIRRLNPLSEPRMHNYYLKIDDVLRCF